MRLFAALILATLTLAEAWSQPASQADDLESRAAAVQALARDGRYAEAVAAWEELLPLQRERLKPDDPKLLESLDGLAGTYELNRRWPQAEALRFEALTLRLAHLGKDHWQSINARCALARVQTLRQRAAAEVSRLERSDAAISQARDLWNANEFAAAARIFETALKSQREILGDADRGYANTLVDLAELYRVIGDFMRSHELAASALKVQETTVGRQHPDAGLAIHLLGRLHYEAGEFEKAEPLLAEALDIAKTAYGVESASYATALQSQCHLYRLMGDDLSAERLARRVLDIRAKTGGTDSILYAFALADLAMILAQREDFPAAEPMFQQALQINQQVYGADHYFSANLLLELGKMYGLQGKQEEALVHSQRALDIRRKLQGPTHPSVAIALNSVGWSHHHQGDFAKAEASFRQAADIFKVAFGEGNPAYAICLHDLAWIYRRTGRLAEATDLYQQGLDINFANQESIAIVQSEAQQLAARRYEQCFLDRYLSHVCLCSDLAERALDATLNWKGAIMMRQRAARSAAISPGLQPTFAELQAVVREWSALVQGAKPTDALAWQARVDHLARQKERLEVQLIERSVDFRQALTKITAAELQAALPPGSALVNYVEYQHHTSSAITKRIFIKPRLLALVVRPGQAVQLFPLGDATAIASAIDQWRTDFGQSPTSQQAAKRLRSRLWTPLEPAVADADLVFVSPDGPLGRLPFAALPGKQPESYLIEDLAIVTLPTPQLLPQLAEPSSAPTSPTNLLVFGGIDYDSHRAVEPLTAVQSLTPTGAGGKGGRGMRSPLGDSPWPFLPGSDEELRAIRDLYNEHLAASPDPQRVDARSGGDATEQAFRELAPQSRVIHLATHGFFADESKPAATRPSAGPPALGDSLLTGQPVAAPGHPPGLLSALVFAGANVSAGQRQSSAPFDGHVADDGYLFADEIASMQLGKADLVVLSACESGLGETAGGEGLLGMQRAFQIAGARSTIASLWKVHDKATQLIMERFYKNYLEKRMPPAAAMREAQLWMINHDAIAAAATRGDEEDIGLLPTEREQPSGKRLSPRYWAAFVTSGRFN